MALQKAIFELRTFFAPANGTMLSEPPRQNQRSSELRSSVGAWCACTAGHTAARGMSKKLPIIGLEEKRQIYHSPGLAHCRCLCRNSRSATRNVMIKLTAAALGYARQPGFSAALIFSDVKPPIEQSAAYTQGSG